MKYYIAYPLPIQEIKKEVEDVLSTEIIVHPKNNQVAFFESELNFSTIEELLEELDVIIINDSLNEWI